MSFGNNTGIQVIHNSPAGYVWVNGSAHLIAIAQISGQNYRYSYVLQDYALGLDLSGPTPVLSQTSATFLTNGETDSWDAGTPTAVYDPVAKQPLFLFVDHNGNVRAAYDNQGAPQSLVDAHGNNFAAVTTPSGFLVVTSSDGQWSEVLFTAYTWQDSPPSASYVQSSQVSVPATQSFDKSTSLRGAVVMSHSNSPGYDYTLTLGLVSGRQNAVTFVQVPINLDTLQVSSEWSATDFTGASHLSGPCLAPDGLPIAVIGVKSQDSAEFIHFSRDSGWSLNNPIAWESTNQIDGVKPSDADGLALGYYFNPAGNSETPVTDVYQVVICPEVKGYEALVSFAGTLTRTQIAPQPGNQEILIGIVEGPPPVPVENVRLPATVSPDSSQSSTTYSYTTSDGTGQTISNTEGVVLQVQGGGGFGVGVQFNLEFQSNFGQMKANTEMTTTVSFEQLNLMVSDPGSQAQVQPIGWLVTLQTDFGAYVYEFKDPTGNDVAGAVSYAQVYPANPIIAYTAYQINSFPEADLSQRPYLPPIPGDLSTYYPGDQAAQQYYEALALPMGNGPFLSLSWTVGAQGVTKRDVFNQTTMTTTVEIDLKAMIGDKFKVPFFSDGITVSAGFVFKYQNSQSQTSSSDVGVAASLGPLPGTVSATPYLYATYHSYTVLVYQLAPDPRWAQWLLSDLGTDPVVANLVSGSQPWKIVYLVETATVNSFIIASPLVPPSSEGWAGNLGDSSSCPNPPWAPGYQVRYSVSFYGGDDGSQPDWESPKGAWTDWLSNDDYCRAILQALPTDPSGKATGRRVYRQFLGSSPEFVCYIPDNTTTTFTDPISPGLC